MLPSRTMPSMIASSSCDDQRRQPFERLVEQQQLRVEHQRAADRQHLLLAARQLVAHVARGARCSRGKVA